MSETTPSLFARRGALQEIEQGSEFQPKFDRDGLIGVICAERSTGDVLMFAHMNAEALTVTIESGYAHFWSRSRGKLWKKGEESGNLLRLVEIRTDCDQDVLLLICDVEGAGVACHTGAHSCFYRKLSRTRTASGAAALENVAPPKRS